MIRPVQRAAILAATVALALSPAASHADGSYRSAVSSRVADAALTPALPGAPSSTTDDAPPDLVDLGLGLSYRCGEAAVSTGTVGVPALVGTCLFETLVTAVPPGINGGDTFNAEVIVVPLARFTNQIVAVGYRGYNLGVRLDGEIGSPLRMTFSVGPVTGTVGSGLTLCDGHASAKYRTGTKILDMSSPGGPAILGTSMIRSLEGSHGPATIWTPDSIAFSAVFQYPTTGTVEVGVDFEGVCGGSDKKMTLSLPPGLEHLSGYADAGGGRNTFKFTNVPTLITVTLTQVTDDTRRISIQHNSGSMAGTITLPGYVALWLTGIPTDISITTQESGPVKHYSVTHNGENFSGTAALTGFGTLNFTKLLKNWDIRVTQNSSGELDTLLAHGFDAPRGQSTVDYDATISGVTINVDIRGITDVDLYADMPNKQFGADIGFSDALHPGRDGFIDVDVTGTVSGIPYNVQMDGVGLGRASLGVSGSSSPNVDLSAPLRLCSLGCGSLDVQVNASFFGLDLGTGSGLSRLGSGQYRVYSPYGAETKAEGECHWWPLLVGPTVQVCAG